MNAAEHHQHQEISNLQRDGGEDNIIETSETAKACRKHRVGYERYNWESSERRANPLAINWLKRRSLRADFGSLLNHT
jgi:hypothetical protein